MTIYSIIKKSKLEGAHRLDAEYYQPEYLELEKELYRTGTYKLWENINGKFITGPFGSQFNVENYVSDTEYRYIRGKDVKEFFLLDDDNVYIPDKDFERLKKYSLRKDDILISVVGTLGNSAIVDKPAIPAIFSCKSTAFRTNAIDPHYFIAYLNSLYGQNLLKRCVRGTVQTGLNIDDLKSLPIFIPSQKKQEVITSIVLKAKQSRYNSKSLYSQAEQLLLEELRIRNLDLGEDLFYTVSSKEAKEKQRFDAEYWQPKYERLTDLFVQKFKGKKIKSLEFIKVTTGQYCDKYEEKGKPYIRGTDISNGTIETNNLVYISENKQIETKKAKEGDVVVTRVGTIGISARLPKEIEGGTFSDNLIRLNFPSEKLNPYYLTLFFNGIGSKLMIRESRGSVQPRLNQETLKEIVIPLLSLSIQQEIADLVQRSHSARKEAKRLLKEAKRKVEGMIEKGANKRR
ncbi:restriction endonuclease subunit S [candidate division WOR-3 bacterium]|nr:restriction endonuclease subunit S [candidate division WOR-3 bacterium]